MIGVVVEDMDLFIYEKSAYFVIFIKISDIILKIKSLNRNLHVMLIFINGAINFEKSLMTFILISCCLS